MGPVHGALGCRTAAHAGARGRRRALPFVLALVGCGAAGLPTTASPEPRTLARVATGRPDATVDLLDDARAALVGASWRYAPVSFAEVQGVDLGADDRPAPSAEHVTFDLVPRPRATSWESASWQALRPHEAAARRGHGHLAMGWFRVELTLPARIGEIELEGATLALEVSVDDYAELWVDGRQRPLLGDRGGAVVAGWNAPNRVVLTRDARPGARIEVAILAMNGPISRSPENFYFVRDAWLDVYRPRAEAAPPRVTLALERDDAAIEGMVGLAPTVERLAHGVGAVRTLLWSEDEASLWLADPRADVVLRYVPALDALGVVRTHAGDSGGGRRLESPGLGGMARDAEGRVVASERGRSRVVRTERSLATTVLVDAAALEGAIPDELAVAGDGSVWVVLERGDTRGLARVGTGGLVSVESPGDLGDLAITREGRALATRLGRAELVSWSADGVPGPALALGGDPAEDLLLEPSGCILLATARGIVLYSPTGARLGTIRTDQPVRALAWGEPGALYAIVGDELVRVGWSAPVG
jgi:gluconolactonase